MFLAMKDWSLRRGMKVCRHHEDRSVKDGAVSDAVGAVHSRKSSPAGPKFSSPTSFSAWCKFCGERGGIKRRWEEAWSCRYRDTRGTGGISEEGEHIRMREGGLGAGGTINSLVEAVREGRGF